jgi:hypothetical protein
MRTFFFAVFSFICIQSAWAHPAHGPNDYLWQQSTCGDAGALVSQREYLCAAEHRLDSEQWHENQFFELLEVVTPEMRSFLLDAQAKWRHQINLLCEAESLIYDGGTLQPKVFEDCVRGAIERQICVISDFHEHYNNVRGTMSLTSVCRN